MKNVKRLICAVLALTLLLTGCAAPKLVLGGTPRVAGTVGDTTVTTGEYLAYLYSTFYNMYYQQGYYQYAAYGYDVWSQEFTYGEGDDEQTVDFAEYIKLTAKDSILRQEALRQMMTEEKIEWDEDALKELEESLAEMEDDALLSLGISNENYIKVYKELNLNEQSLFYGRYREGGTEAVSDEALREYFDENYLSYKIIEISLTDDEGAELDESGKKEITDQLKGYLATYNNDKNFEAVVDAYNKANAAEGEEVEESTDEGNRINADATQMDEELVEAIRGVKVGQAEVVTYGTTAALILRLDINDPETLFEDETDNILYGMKYEAFDEEVEKKVADITIELKESVVEDCTPANFVTDAQ